MKIDYDQIQINAQKRSEALHHLNVVLQEAPEALAHALALRKWMEQLLAAYANIDSEGRSYLPKPCADILRHLRSTELDELIGGSDEGLTGLAAQAKS